MSADPNTPVHNCSRGRMRSKGKWTSCVIFACPPGRKALLPVIDLTHMPPRRRDPPPAQGNRVKEHTKNRRKFLTRGGAIQTRISSKWRATNNQSDASKCSRTHRSTNCLQVFHCESLDADDSEQSVLVINSFTQSPWLEKPATLTRPAITSDGRLRYSEDEPA